MNIFDAIKASSKEALAIIKAKPEVANSRDEDGATPLMYVARHVRDSKLCDSMVQSLLQAHAEVNAVDVRTGQIALHMACDSGNESFVKVLQACAKDKVWPYFRDFKNQTPAAMAFAKDVKLWKLLLEPCLPAMDGQPVHLVIIGVGAAGTATFIQLVRNLEKWKGRADLLSKIKVSLIDRRQTLGMGTAYSPELNSATSVLNVAAGGMSIDPGDGGDFVAYIKALGDAGKLKEELGLASELGLSPKTADPRGFYPRLFYGRYLSQRLQMWIKKAQDLGIVVMPMPETAVLDEQPLDPKKRTITLHIDHLAAKKQEVIEATHVYYTTGHWVETDSPGEASYKSLKGYIKFPKNTEAMQKDNGVDFSKPHEIAVFGSSLSALDAIFSILLKPGVGKLSWNEATQSAVYTPLVKHKITCYSRRGLFPRVRPRESTDAPLTYLNQSGVEFAKLWFGKPLSLPEAIILLNKDLSQHLGRPVDVEMEANPFGTAKKEGAASAPNKPFGIVAEDVKRALGVDKDKYASWYQVIHALFPILRVVYRNFSIDEQRLFDEKYSSNFLWAFAPMPDTSARVLIAMRNAEALDIFRSVGLPTTTDNKSFSIKYLDHSGNQKDKKHDFLIGTTGLANNFDNDSSPLTNNLKEKKLITFSDPYSDSKAKGMNMWITDDDAYEVVSAVQGKEQHSPARRAIGFFLHSQMWDVQSVPTVKGYGQRVADIYANEFIHKLIGEKMFGEKMFVPPAKL